MSDMIDTTPGPEFIVLDIEAGRISDQFQILKRQPDGTYVKAEGHGSNWPTDWVGVQNKLVIVRGGKDMSEQSPITEELTKTRQEKLQKMRKELGMED